MLLELDRMSSGYGRSPVLHDVSLAVEAGEIVALIGANGAGKSTSAEHRHGSGCDIVRRHPLRWRANRSSADASDCPHRHRPGAGTAPIVRQHVGRGKPPDGRLHQRRSPYGRDVAGGAVSRASRSCASAAANSRVRCPAASSRWWRSRAPPCRARCCCLLDEPSLGLAPMIVARIMQQIVASACGARHRADSRAERARGAGDRGPRLRAGEWADRPRGTGIGVAGQSGRAGSLSWRPGRPLRDRRPHSQQEACDFGTVRLLVVRSNDLCYRWVFTSWGKNANACARASVVSSRRWPRRSPKRLQDRRRRFAVGRFRLCRDRRKRRRAGLGKGARSAGPHHRVRDARRRNQPGERHQCIPPRRQRSLGHADLCTDQQQFRDGDQIDRVGIQGADRLERRGGSARRTGRSLAVQGRSRTARHDGRALPNMRGRRATGE